MGSATDPSTRPVAPAHNPSMTQTSAAPGSAFLQRLLSGEVGGFTPFERALDGLGGEDAVRRPDGSPHSVADVLAHMVFWQQRFLRIVDGEEPTRVEHAADGWPGASAEEWPSLVESYLRGLARYREIARDESELARPLVPGKEGTVGASVASYYLHEAHHLGQVILLRRMIGAWPPPGGGDTW